MMNFLNIRIPHSGLSGDFCDEGEEMVIVGDFFTIA